MAAQGFWLHREEAEKVIAQANQLRSSIAKVQNFRKHIDELKGWQELLDSMGDTVAESDLQEFQASVDKRFEEMEALELESFLSEPNDHNNAIFSIHAGAGGTESCDWAGMLLRMYLRWAEVRGYQADIEDIQEGDEAGVSRVILRVIGRDAYGYLKAERGVHRLVRISPFDANKKRHTSFCAIDVIAEVEEDVAIEVNEKDLRIDTYRASGKGGQHVNKTDSAVRLTHLPSGIVVTCQNERSQHKNKATAMKMLKSRLYERSLDEKRSSMEKFYGAKGEIGWGNQIRSYVFQPYQMVKDLRTGFETGNIQAVMDGGIDGFINAWFRAGRPSTRNKLIHNEE